MEHSSSNPALDKVHIPMPSAEAKPERFIPWMQLGNPKAEFNAPPPAMPAEASADERAAIRFRVKGNVVLTGGAGRLALESARALLEHGASGLALLDLPHSFTTPGASSAIQSLRDDFPKSTILTAPIDVTDAEGVQKVVDEMREKLGELSILCAFAGMVHTLCAEDIPPAEWRRVIDVNTSGAWFAAQAVGKHMIKDGHGGRILLISSISGHSVNYPQPQVAYNASKAAILHIRASLAAEWSRYGIRVNSISPGYMDTILNEGNSLAPFREVWANRNPMGRMGDPREMTGPVVFLCSQFAGSYVNGADLLVDGGGMVF